MANTRGVTRSTTFTFPTGREIYNRNGYVSYGPDITGRNLTWQFSHDVGGHLASFGNAISKPHFYVISSPCNCNDPMDNKGKVKIGMSGAQTNGYALRINHYRNYWGDNAKLHMLIIFNTRRQATNFESAVKLQLKKRRSTIIPNNLNFGRPRALRTLNQRNEWFRLDDLNEILNIIIAKRAEGYWQRRA